MKVILISGAAGSGKDTVASMIHRRLSFDGHKVLITHFADLLKYICCNFIGWDGKKDLNGRQMLQYVGTDVIRKNNPTFWVDFVVTMLKFFPDSWSYVIIPDARFPDEITVMEDNGFDTTHLRVIRPSFTTALSEKQQNHSSETALNDTKADYYIENIGNVSELEESVIKWIEENLYGGKS